MCGGALHFWNSLRILPDIPSATHHVNGREGFGGQPSRGPLRQPHRIAILIAEAGGRLWQWTGICLAFHEATDRGETELWPWSLSHSWALSQGFPASPLSPLTSVMHTQPGLASLNATSSNSPNCLTCLNGSSWPGPKACWIR